MNAVSSLGSRDVTVLVSEDVDWTKGTVSFLRRKRGVVALVHLRPEALQPLKDLSESLMMKCAFHCATLPVRGE